MACFAVSAAEALIVKGVEKHQKKIEKAQIESGTLNIEETPKVPLSSKLKWLSWMLWGGVVLLAFEHVWHGEIVPWFPFLTAMSNPADAMGMMREMATVGVTMAAIITLVWFVMCKVSDAIMAENSETASQES